MLRVTGFPGPECPDDAGTVCLWSPHGSAEAGRFPAAPSRVGTVPSPSRGRVLNGTGPGAGGREHTLCARLVRTAGPRGARLEPRMEAPVRTAAPGPAANRLLPMQKYRKSLGPMRAPAKTGMIGAFVGELLRWRPGHCGVRPLPGDLLGVCSLLLPLLLHAGCGRRGPAQKQRHQ